MYSRTCNAVILVLDAQNPQAVEDTQDILHDPNIKCVPSPLPLLYFFLRDSCCLPDLSCSPRVVCVWQADGS